MRPVSISFGRSAAHVITTYDSITQEQNRRNVYAYKKTTIWELVSFENTNHSDPRFLEKKKRRR